tara:strand:- start:4072 stop:4413 length:342 start_codon:yes stop_codon:yes gene_type:complete
MYKNLDTGMTRIKYLNMCEQLNKEPDDEELPPDWEDFPELIQNAINTFNQLGDRVFPEIGYVGKDYTNLPYFTEMYEVQDTEFFLEILSWLDSRAIKKSSENLKKEYDKLKRK